VSDLLRDQLDHIARNQDEMAKDIEDDACFHRGVAEGIRRALSIMREDEKTDIRFAPCPDCGAGHDSSGCDYSCPSRTENIRDVFPELPAMIIPMEFPEEEIHSPHPETAEDA
jgi:hypothetical protein